MIEHPAMFGDAALQAPPEGVHGCAPGKETTLALGWSWRWHVENVLRLEREIMRASDRLAREKANLEPRWLITSTIQGEIWDLQRSQRYHLEMQAACEAAFDGRKKREGQFQRKYARKEKGRPERRWQRDGRVADHREAAETRPLIEKRWAMRLAREEAELEAAPHEGFWLDLMLDDFTCTSEACDEEMSFTEVFETVGGQHAIGGELRTKLGSSGVAEAVVVRERRSEAARKGWERRRVRQLSPVQASVLGTGGAG